MARNTLGWFGWFSVAGFVVLTALFVLDLFADTLWAFSAFWTLVVAVVAGIGAIARYAGEDPTADTYEETTARAVAGQRGPRFVTSGRAGTRHTRLRGGG